MPCICLPHHEPETVNIIVPVRSQKIILPVRVCNANITISVRVCNANIIIAVRVCNAAIIPSGSAMQTPFCVVGCQGKVSAAFRSDSAPFCRPPRRVPPACHPAGELRHHQVSALQDIHQPFHGVVRGWQVSTQP